VIATGSAILLAPSIVGHLGLNQYHAGVLAAIVAIVAQMGDLVESVIKRDVGAKDSGALIPGHGGALDRMDSFILSAPFVYYYLVWILGRT
jgi:phosphatidate cytidylyltransferase